MGVLIVVRKSAYSVYVYPTLLNISIKNKKGLLKNKFVIFVGY